MKISAIKSVGIKNNFKNSLTQNTPLSASNLGEGAPSSNEDKTSNNRTKTIAYAAGAVILAGIGAYVFRKELGLVKKIKQEVPNPKPNPKPNSQPNPNAGTGGIGGGENIPPVNPFQWIIDFNKSGLKEVKAVIDGYAGRFDGKFLKAMEQKALQTAGGSSEKPLHEAANLLEQTYITQFLRGDAAKKEGLDHIFSRMKGEGSLVYIYGKMPFKEFTARLENLKLNEFNAQTHKGMTPGKFVNKVTRLVKQERMHQDVVNLSRAGRFDEAAEHLESYYGKRYRQIQNPTADDLKHLVASIMKDPSSHIVYGIDGSAGRLYNLNNRYFGAKIDPLAAKKVVDETFAQSLLRYTMNALSEGAAEPKIEIFKPSSAPSIRNFIKYEEKPTKWLVEFNNKKMGEVNRIINENGHLHGNDYLQMMEKIAGDFSHDKNRERPAHEAANFLEQAYLRHYLKGDTNVRTGLDNMLERIQVNGKLMDFYRQMPVQEAVERLNNLKLTALKADKYTGISAEKFVDKVGRLLIQQNMRNEISGLSAAGKFEEAAGVLENYYAQRILKEAGNTPEDFKRFVKAVAQDKDFAAIYGHRANDFGARFFSFNEKYLNSELKPEITDNIAAEVLNNFIIKSLNEKGRALLKETKPREAANFVEDFLIDILKHSPENNLKTLTEELKSAVVLKEIYEKLPRTETAQRVNKLKMQFLKNLNEKDKKTLSEYLDSLAECGYINNK